MSRLSTLPTCNMQTTCHKNQISKATICGQLGFAPAPHCRNTINWTHTHARTPEHTLMWHVARVATKCINALNQIRPKILRPKSNSLSPSHPRFAYACCNTKNRWCCHISRLLLVIFFCAAFSHFNAAQRSAGDRPLHKKCNNSNDQLGVGSQRGREGRGQLSCLLQKFMQKSVRAQKSKTKRNVGKNATSTANKRARARVRVRTQRREEAPRNKVWVKCSVDWNP